MLSLTTILIIIVMKVEELNLRKQVKKYVYSKNKNWHF